MPRRQPCGVSLEGGKRKLLCCALSLLLACSFLPVTTARAAEGDEGASAGLERSGSNGETDAVDEDCTKGLPTQAAGEEDDNASIAVASVEADAEAVQLASRSEFAIDYAPVRNTTIVSASVSDAATLVSDGIADAVAVEATMSHGGTVTRSISREASLAELSATGGSFDVDFGDFGRFSVVAQFKKGNEIVFETSAVSVGVTADIYNIAPVSATLPVTMFSLNLWGEGSIRESGPVILLMERPSSYDWDSLPRAEEGTYGVYGLPYFSREKISYQPADFDVAASLFRERAVAMAEYVKDLMELDPTSRVNLYCVDGYIDLVQSIIYANRIPEGQYSITVLSDGAFTYEQFGSSYDSAYPEQQHTQLVSKWNAAKEYAYSNGEVAEGYGPWEACDQFWAAVDSEPNAQIWVARKDLLASPEDGNAFGLSVQGNSKVVQVAIASLLQSNIQSSEANEEAFKALYNFNDSYFESAKEQGKDVMLLLGTRVDTEQAFSEYARFVMSYYGDDYVYYYKGHPGTPTDMYPWKTAELEALGITDVDSSIAAELILFFNPTIYLSGYGSSTYASVPEGMAKGMFAMTKEQGLANPQYQNMEYWMSKIDSESPSEIVNECIPGHDTFLVEFSDEVAAAKGYDIALWDSTAAVIRYYQRVSDDALSLVAQEEGVASECPVAEGTYAIMTDCALGKVLDVEGGSLANEANVQSYGYNGTAAQQWRVSYDEEGLATLINVGSGKVLDVTGGQGTSGTNVQQYEANGTLAQKWRIVRNSGDSVTISSALDESTVLDIDGASSSDGANVQVWEENGTKAQSFQFLPIYPSISPDGQVNLADGVYRILSAVNTNYAVDVTGWSKEDGARIQLWGSTGADNQAFRIERLDNGYYSIVSVWSRKALDVTGCSIIPGAPVQQWDRGANAANQQWRIVQGTGGEYTIQNVQTGLMLDVAGGAAYDGNGINVYTPNGTQAQRWILSPVI